MVTDDITEYFQFEPEFNNGSLDIFDILYDDSQIAEEDIEKGEGTTVIRMIGSVNAPIASATDHFILKEDGKYSFNTNGDVLIGTMSFQMTADEFDKTWFELRPGNSSPTTGIRITTQATGTPKYYTAQSTFRFTDEVASKEARLSNLVVSTGVTDTENPDNSTYKEYPFTPTFDKDISPYEIKLLEYLDNMDITATTLDGKATLKIKVPKRDEDGNLVYQADGTTIEYEEKEMLDKIPLNVILNKLGEPDTILTITSTAEDGKTTKEYQVTIKRPYATIKGKAILADFDDEGKVQDILDVYGIELNNRVDINLYKPNLAEWESIPDIYQIVYPDPFTYEKLEDVPKEASMTSEDNGVFEIYIIPGEYDIQVTRLGYLDYIYSDLVLKEGDIIEMGEIRLAAGDINRDGTISQEDINQVKQVMDMLGDNVDFLENYNPSQIGIVSQEDLNYAKQNQDRDLQIVYFNPNNS